MSLDASITASRATLRQRLGSLQPRVAIVLGSGWGAVAEQVDDAVDIPYADLPAFPRLGVGGHAGVLRAGASAASRCWCWPAASTPTKPATPTA
jgi:purine nucleoside phosphorylase